MQLSAQQFSQVVAELKKAPSPTAGAEKRRFSRIEVQAKVRLYIVQERILTRSFTAITRDISFGGIGLLHGSPMERGQQFIARLPYSARADLYLLCTATFTRALADGLFGLGAQFISVAEHELGEGLDRNRSEEIQRIQQSILG